MFHFYFFFLLSKREQWDGVMGSSYIWLVMIRGEIIAFVLTGANVNDKDPAVFDVLAKRLYGKLFADKGYISQKLFDSLFEEGIQLVTVLPFVDSFHQFVWCKYLHLGETKPLFA